MCERCSNRVRTSQFMWQICVLLWTFKYVPSSLCLYTWFVRAATGHSISNGIEKIFGAFVFFSFSFSFEVPTFHLASGGISDLWFYECLKNGSQTNEWKEIVDKFNFMFYVRMCVCARRAANIDFTGIHHNGPSSAISIVSFLWVHRCQWHGIIHIFVCRILIFLIAGDPQSPNDK